MASLVALRTTTDSRRCTAAVVHALWIAESRLTVLADISLLALADLILVAPSSVGTLLVTLGVRTYYHNYRYKYLVNISALR